MAQIPIIPRIVIDTRQLQRTFWHVTQAFTAMGDALSGRPVRPREPLPRRLHPGTAREYRTARRRYGRELRAWRKTVA